MNIDLSEAELEKLLILAHLGEWMANATRSKPIKEFEIVASKIFALAEGTSRERLVDEDDKTGRWWPSRELEEKAHPLVDEYDDESFWEELCERLVDRDLLRKYSRKQLASMSWEERYKIREPLEFQYENELASHGLDRFGIVRDAAE